MRIKNVILNKKDGCVIEFVPAQPASIGKIYRIEDNDGDKHYFEVIEIATLNQNVCLVKAKEIGYYNLFIHEYNLNLCDLFDYVVHPEIDQTVIDKVKRENGYL